MPDLLEPLLSAGRVARILGIEEETLGTWRRRGYGPRWYKVGKRIKYAFADLQAWVEKQASDNALTSSSESEDRQ